MRRGAARGAAIGFPTANIDLGEALEPALGVYAVRVAMAEGAATRWRDGVANLGRRPTFGGGEVVLETHLLDFDGDLRGRLLRVALVAFLRPEMRFPGVDALRAQIAADRERAAALLAERARTPGWFADDNLPRPAANGIARAGLKRPVDSPRAACYNPRRIEGAHEAATDGGAKRQPALG